MRLDKNCYGWICRASFSFTWNRRLNVDGVDDKLDLEELRDVEEGREDDDRHDVGEDDASPRVDALALVVVLDRTPDRSVPLQRQRHRDVDGAAEDKVVHGVQAVSECVFVKLKYGIMYNGGSQPGVHVFPGIRDKS